MAGTKDIKDFTKYPSLSDNDYLLGTKTDLGGTDAGLLVSSLKTQLAVDIKPTIKNGYWWVLGVNTGISAVGKTPVFRKTSAGIEMKYENDPDTAYQLLIPLSDLMFKFSELTPEQLGLLKLKFSDLTEADKLELRGDAFTFEDFTPEQLSDLCLTWEKLTPEQKTQIKGERGFSAYEVWTQLEGNVGKTEDEYLAFLCQPATEAATEARDQLVQISEEVSQVVEATNIAKDAANTAAVNAKSVSDHPGYIGSDYHVYTWDYVTGSYNKTETILRPEGFSVYRTYMSIEAMNSDLANIPEGKFVLINTGSVENPDTAKLYVRATTSFEYLVDMSGAVGFTGKTPQITIGTVTVGASASAGLSPDGIDEDGNPKFKLNIVIVAGPQGLTPVLETGTIATGLPGTNVSAELVPNGQTADGRDKYLLNLTIPQGTPGSGSGNIFVDPVGIVASKKYLFVPGSNESPIGTLIEYVAPIMPEQIQPDWNATEGKGAILNKPTIPSKTSQLSNDSSFATTADIGNHNTSAVAHSDIRQALSDVEAIARGKSRAKVFDTVAALNTWLGVPANVATLQIGDNFYIKALDVPDYWWDGTAKQPIESEKVDLTNYVQKETGKGLFSGSYNDLSNKPTIPTVPGVATPTTDGLMSIADKKKIDRQGSQTTATTVANLDVNYEIINVTLSANASLSVSATGVAYNSYSITAYVYCPVACTIAIPTTGNYISMCGSSYTCPAGKRVEFNLSCVGGLWRIAKMEQE